MLPCGSVRRVSLARNATLLHNVVSAWRRTVTIRHIAPPEKDHTRHQDRSFRLTQSKKVRPSKFQHGPQEIPGKKLPALPCWRLLLMCKFAFQSRARSRGLHQSLKVDEYISRDRKHLSRYIPRICMVSCRGSRMVAVQNANRQFRVKRITTSQIASPKNSGLHSPGFI